LKRKRHRDRRKHKENVKENRLLLSQLLLSTLVLKEARAKSKALKEIIEGNELFKKQAAAVPNDKPAVFAFKEAHKDQSPETRQIVAETKANSNS